MRNSGRAMEEGEMERGGRRCMDVLEEKKHIKLTYQSGTYRAHEMSEGTCNSIISQYNGEIKVVHEIFATDNIVQREGVTLFTHSGMGSTLQEHSSQLSFALSFIHTSTTS